MAGKIGRRYEHQVFLSFRGLDTRIFVGHLFSALKKTGFKVFLDNDGLEHGKDIQLKLFEAIGCSEMSVVILSERYADSRWCLDELVRIMEFVALSVHRVLPVFFDVEPTVVRNQTGVYTDAFQALQERFGGERDRVEKWRSALKQVASLRGLSLNAERDESLLVENITSELRKIVNTSELYVPRYIVGRDLILEEINIWLRDGSSDVGVGLIYGLGGIGKTTIAEIAYNNNARLFDGCSFLADFTRKISQPDGLACLLDQLILDVTGKPGNKLRNVNKGMNDIRAILCCKKVLVVLDDIDELNYLPNAFDDRNLFGEGSKIIITSRNEELKKVSLFKTKFRVTELSFSESMELLKLHASIKRDDLSQHEEELLDGFLQHCQGLPLAFSVLGPLLRNETETMWESRLKELKTYPDHEIFDVFRLSFDCINDKYTKDLFLYIACFFVGMDKAYALAVLEGCKLKPISGLQNLINRCLVTVDCQDKLMMHQSIEEMGKEIARQEAINDPGMRRMIWRTEDSISVLQNNQGTSIVRGLRLDLPKLNSHTLPEHHKFESYPKRIRLAFSFWRYTSTNNSMSIKTSSFATMSNLNLLLLNNVQLDGGYEVFPKKLKLLLWNGCPLHSIPSNFHLNEVVVLDIQNSSLLHAWEASKYMGALKILDLSYSRFLICSPDLSSSLMLECLFLRGCVSLLEVCESIGNLRYLRHLNMEGCESLVRLHKSIGNLKKLTILNMGGCKSLVSFPVPVSVVELTLEGCKSFFMFPNQMASLIYSSFSNYVPFLKKLDMANCGINRDDILEQLSSAASLQYLDLSENPIRLLNSDMRAFPMLIKLDLTKCTKLQSVLQLPSHALVNLRFCSSLKKVSYIFEANPSNRDCAIPTLGCDLLDKVDYGFGNTQVFEWTRNMDEGQAKLLGFPELNTFFLKNSLMFSSSFAIGRGRYQGGTYQIYLPHDHIAKWFTTIETATELQYTVPLNSLPIRALNLGHVVSTCKRNFSIYRVTIKNLTSMWEWSLDSSYREWRLYSSSKRTVTWLSHWCVMEHREIKSGDLLKVSLSWGGTGSALKWGVSIIYEEQQVVEDKAGLLVKDVRKNGKSCSRQSNLKICSKKTETSIGDQNEEEDEEYDGPAAAAVWYNNSFRSPHLDLSIFKDKISKYERKYIISVVWNSPARLVPSPASVCPSKSSSCQPTVSPVQSPTDDTQPNKPNVRETHESRVSAFQLETAGTHAFVVSAARFCSSDQKAIQR